MKNNLSKTLYKKRVAVLFGGCSSEYEVSLQSAFAVISHIKSTRYTVIPIGIDRFTGKWFLYQGDISLIEKDDWNREEFCIPVYASLDKSIRGLNYIENGIVKTIHIDVALPILHGKNGEDGTVQGVIELAGIPVIGCDLLSSALCMDKELAHRIVEANGINVAKSITLKKGYTPADIKMAETKLQFPLFVKPVRAGSSFGITKVTHADGLLSAIETAFIYDSTVILEEMISGFEIGCAIIGVNDLQTGEIDEIELSDGFFDYTEKYTLKTSSIHVPARISAKKAIEAKKIAIDIYKALGCSFFARVDMFLTVSGEIYFNEVNTIPGFTAHSRFPNMFKAMGISFENIIDRLLAMEE